MGEIRYEVEIQLGATDESHIIRTLEYWDVERRLRPQYEHGVPPMSLFGDTQRDLKELVRNAKGLPADPLDSRTDPYKPSSTEDHAVWQELEEEMERGQSASHLVQSKAEVPQPSLDPELEALKERMRINFPDAPTAGRSSAGRGANGSGRPLEVARRHEEQRPREGELEL